MKKPGTSPAFFMAARLRYSSSSWYAGAISTIGDPPTVPVAGAASRCRGGADTELPELSASENVSTSVLRGRVRSARRPAD